MFKIGDFSKLTKVSVRMLRYYDQHGLLIPEKTDDFTGYRYYSANQIERLNEIISLRDLGFNVSEIVLYLAEKSADVRKDMFDEKRRLTQELIEREKARLHSIEAVVTAIQKEEQKVLSYNVKSKCLPSFKAVSYRKTIPSYDEEGTLWEEMSMLMGDNNIKTTGEYYAAYHDGAFRQGDVDIEIVMSVDEFGESVDGLKFKNTQPIEKAVCTLIAGDYSKINPAYEFLAKHIENNGLEICTSPRQKPIKSPHNEQNSQNYLTEIQIPVK